MLIYVAGKYSGDVDKNIAEARRWAIKLWEAGHAVICPHLNTAHMEKDCKASYEDYLDGDLKMVSRCDMIFLLPGWEESKGANGEAEYAEQHGVWVWEASRGIPPLNPTEVKFPVQAEAFIHEIMSMYRMHLKKNADYSPANVAGPGLPGILTRMWDKMVRLMNLLGFDIEVVKSELRAPKQAANEAVEDSNSDLSVYSIILKLYMAGKWGR